MNLLEFLQFLTVIFGIFCASLSISLFAYFIRSEKGIGRAVAFMLLGESVGAAVTVAFSLTSDGVWDFVGDEGSLVLRWIMFTAMSFSSIHLAIQVKKILDIDDGKL